VLTDPGWAAVPGLHHGFLDRAESAETGTGDWDRALQATGIALPIATVRQVHGTRVVTAASDDGLPEADGIATGTRGLAVGVVTADCVPALLLARSQGTAAAVHAGWRGAAAGVLESALAHLRAQFGVEPGDVEAVLGPSIGPCCYRVGSEVHAAFSARTSTITAPAWTPAGDRLLLDLRLAERLLLEAAGVRSVTVVGPCTACTPTLASYRRDGAATGRQLSFIGWTAA
jgi:purine-nucleoside/S-methyl-5'-thioadenosine phosphorylase / adenosine deaminase